MTLVLLSQILHPAPQAPDPTASIEGWVWAAVVLAIVLAGGIVLSSRR